MIDKIFGEMKLVIFIVFLSFGRLLWGQEVEGLSDPRRRLFFSQHLNVSCTYNGKKMCCPLIHPEQYKFSYPRDTSVKHLLVQEKCTLTREYTPSPYELRHLNMTKSWLGLSEAESLELLQKALIEDIPHVERWLGRVKTHMSNLNVYDFSSYSNYKAILQGLHADDAEYLSFFKFTRSCGNKQRLWLEFIEPLTIHARHPYGLAHCICAAPYLAKLKEMVPEKTPAFGELVDMDYLLLKPGNRLSDGIYHNSLHSSVQTSHYFFDAGAGEFSTGLMFFLCSYINREIVFDRAFGWECKGINHNDYWTEMPSSVVSMYTFYNTFASASEQEPHSIIRIIKEVTKEHDFVSFKLDIDNPSVEIPIALQLLKDKAATALVDEFFFELHFRCEIMTYCGWKRDTPQEDHGLILDRYHTLEFFAKFRHEGVRAHIWP